MSVQRVLAPNYDEGVDRKTLKVLHERFLKISHGRLQRSRDALGARQQVVLDLLPLLFQVNHPLLPGYVSHQTPARFADFTPSKPQIQAAQRYSRTFRYKDESRQSCDLHSLFLMGSSGTVAQSDGSDMDLWLCHQPDLDVGQRHALRQKCDLISRWAGEMGQELHVFLIDEREFRAGRHQACADAEDCGSAQHFLLLDEFYRTSILLAGNGPLWWLIPAGQEAQYPHYAHLLQHKRFIRPGQYADLGGVDRIPPEEFIGAGLWQLYKGIDSPYKSVLKLLLMEVYAQEPERLNLSLHFKQAVYEDRLDLDELDPYILVYRRLETYLQERGEHERLDLVRRCLYLKANERLTQSPGRGGKGWRRLLMERLTTEWGWGSAEFKRLDSRPRWKVQQAQNERRVLVNELTHSYRFLSQYARTRMEPAAIKVEDVNLLGRKLYAAFQRKAGKIEFLNPGIAPHLAEEQLAFHHKSSQQLSSDANGWLLYRDLASASDAAFQPALKRSNSLVELVAWSYFNGLLDSATSLSLAAGDSQASLYELQGIVASFRQILPLPLPPVAQDDFRYNSYPQRCALFINVGQDPMADLTRQGIYKVSSRTDALGYSSQRSNLIQTLDLVTLNSWQELTVNRFDQGDALIQCLKSFLAMRAAVGSRQTPPQVSVHCYCPTRAGAIAARIEELLRDVSQALFASPEGRQARYVLEVDSRFFVLQFIEGEPRFAGFESQADLRLHLQRPQRQYSPILLDRHALADSALAAVCALARPGQIQVFYQVRSQALNEASGPTAQVDLYVLDERGSLITHSAPFYDQQTLLTPLHRFLRAVQDRHQMHHSLLEGTVLAPELLVYELIQAPQTGRFEVVSRRLPNDAMTTPYLEVQAIASQAPAGTLQFDIFCDHQEFAAQEYGDQLIPAVAHYIVSRRAGRELYPCYITDLGLPQELEHQSYQPHPQTVQYLEYKWQLEQRLNQAQQSFRQSAAQSTGQSTGQSSAEAG